MISNNRRVFIVSLFIVIVCNTLNAQTTYSPYSMLGIGEIETRDYSRTSGMAGVGVGIRDYDYLNPLNPAGLTALDSLRFIFDISGSVRQSSFSFKSKSESAFNGNFQKIAFGFRASPLWSVSVGVKPFTNVGYQIYNTVDVEGTTQTKSVYMEGSGGLYSVYMSNALRLGKRFSFGITSMYVGGTINQTENQVDYLFSKKSRTSQFYNTFGLQYHQKNLVLGLTYGYKQRLNFDNTTEVYDSEYTLIDEQNARSSAQFIPQNIGLGFSTSSRKIIFGMDYQYQQWSGLKSGIDNIKIVDFHQLKAGLGYTPKTDYLRYKTQSQYQVGAAVSRSYIQVENKSAIGFSVSVGYSYPVLSRFGSSSLLNFGLEYGNTASSPTSYIRESYFLLTFNYTLFETWFKRHKLD